MGQINKERERYVYVNMWGRGGGVEGQGFGEGVEDKGLGDGRGEVALIICFHGICVFGVWTLDIGFQP